MTFTNKIARTSDGKQIRRAEITLETKRSAIDGGVQALGLAQDETIFGSLYS